jgi:heptosyltransferase III
MQNILVLRGGALGDFIVTMPALAALRRAWPTANIELAGNATAAALAFNRRLLNAAHSQHEARWSALFRNEPLPSEFARWLGQFNLIVSYWPDSDGAFRRHFPTRPGQQFLSAPAMPTCAPAAAHYNLPLVELGITAGDVWYPIAPLGSPPNRSLPESHANLPIALHPGSGSPKKNWPAKRWDELIRRLPGPILVILGEAELERGGKAPSFACTKNVRTAANLPLEQLVDELNRCRLFIGHDSGVSHLAAACGLPCVLLFGPTDPDVWAPQSPSVRVLHKGSDLDAISVADVLDSIGDYASPS